jgi:hypothetical protein
MYDISIENQEVVIKVGLNISKFTPTTTSEFELYTTSFIQKV